MALDLGISLFASTGILVVLAFVTTVFRCIARVYIVRAFGIDDWLIILTLGLYIFYSAWVFQGRSIDRGRPDSQIPVSDQIPALRAFYFAELSYFLATCFLKMSIGTFLLRIVKTKTQRWLIFIALTIVFMYSMVSLFVAVFQCSPVWKFWHPENPAEGKCLSHEVILFIGYSHGCVIALSDFFFACLPMFVVWSLQMDQSMKISVTILMGFGAIAGVTTIARLPYISAVVSKKDFFLNTARLATLSSVEPGLGIILASAAATRPLFRFLIAKTKTWWSTQNEGTEMRCDAVDEGGGEFERDVFVRLDSIEAVRMEYCGMERGRKEVRA